MLFFIDMRKQKVLLVDDDSLFLTLTEKKLKKVAYLDQVSCILDVKEAREYLDACVKDELPFPDVIFLDINMPGIGGMDFAELYSRRYAGHAPRTRLVMLTSSNSSRERKLALQIPAVDDFIQKPLTDEKLSRVFL